jgi:hypothetical protein
MAALGGTVIPRRGYPLMRRPIYTSQSLIGSNSAELDAIVGRANTLNKSAGLTGMLWADDDRFVQVLEGEHDVVAHTITRIRADPRHKDLEILCDRLVSQRMFGNWSIVFKLFPVSTCPSSEHLAQLAA